MASKQSTGENGFYHTLYRLFGEVVTYTTATVFSFSLMYYTYFGLMPYGLWVNNILLGISAAIVVFSLAQFSLSVSVILSKYWNLSNVQGSVLFKVSGIMFGIIVLLAIWFPLIVMSGQAIVELSP